MPTYQIGLQDGRTLQIDADSQDAALAGAQHFLQNNPAPQSDDVGAGVKKGLAEAPGDVAGTPGLLQQVQSYISNKAADALGVSDENRPYFNAASRLLTSATTGGALGLPGSDAATPDQINNATGANTLPDAQSGLGQAAQTAVRTAANPFSYLGPAGPLKSLASAEGAAMLSKGAETVAKNLGANDTAASLVGAGAGFLSPTLSGKAKAGLNADEAADRADQLLNAGGQGRNDYRDLGFAARPGVVQNWATNKINQYGTTRTNAVDPRGFSAADAPQTHEILQDIANHNGGAWSADLSGWYDQLKNVTGTTADEAAARDAAQALSQRMTSFTPQQTLLGDPAVAARIWNGAQDNYSAGKRLETLNDTLKNAANGANVANSGLGGGNMLRTAVKQMINPKTNGFRGFNQNESDALQQFVDGTNGQSMTRMAANMLGGGGGIGGMIAGGIVGSTLGPFGTLGGGELGRMVGPMIAGQLLRRAYNNNVVSGADRLRALVASRSPLAQSTPGFIPPAVRSAMLRRMMNTYQGSQQ